MNVYVWHRVAKCSDSYHRGGGVVVFAASEERARALASTAEGCEIAATEMPEVRACADGEERLFIMPDAGCC